MAYSDFIAIFAVCVALVSVWYARRANEIAIHNNLRPLRLAVYRLMKEFIHYCSTYRTLQSVGAVNGTRDLVERIESFKWEIDLQGNLEMPAIETKAVEFQKKAWQLQRILERLAGGRNNPAEPAYQTAEENLDGLVEWFANEHRDLKATFQPYLDVK